VAWFHTVLNTILGRGTQPVGNVNGLRQIKAALETASQDVSKFANSINWRMT